MIGRFVNAWLQYRDSRITTLEAQIPTAIAVMGEQKTKTRENHFALQKIHGRVQELERLGKPGRYALEGINNRIHVIAKQQEEVERIDGNVEQRLSNIEQGWANECAEEQLLDMNEKVCLLESKIVAAEEDADLARDPVRSSLHLRHMGKRIDELQIKDTMSYKLAAAASTANDTLVARIEKLEYFAAAAKHVEALESEVGKIALTLASVVVTNDALLQSMERLVSGRKEMQKDLVGVDPLPAADQEAPLDDSSP